MGPTLFCTRGSYAPLHDGIDSIRSGKLYSHIHRQDENVIVSDRILIYVLGSHSRRTAWLRVMVRNEGSRKGRRGVQHIRALEVDTCLHFGVVSMRCIQHHAILHEKIIAIVGTKN